METITIPAKTIQIPSFVSDNKDDYFYSTTGQVYESDDFLFAKHSSISKFREEAIIQGFSKEDIEYFVEHYSDFDENSMTQQQFETEWNRLKESLIKNTERLKELISQQNNTSDAKELIKLRWKFQELQIEDAVVFEEFFKLIDIRDNDPILSQIYKKEE